MLITQPTAKPTRKIAAVGIGGALSVIVIWLLNDYVLSAPLPVEVATAITALISAGCGYVVRDYA